MLFFKLSKHYELQMTESIIRLITDAVTHTGSPYLMHGVEQLSELIKTLPILAGVLLALHDGFSQLLNVGHPNLIEHRLALQAVFWHCRAEKRQGQELVPTLHLYHHRAERTRFPF